MRAIREEDAGMKIPALLHLSRLGYAYTPRGELRREPEANLLPEQLRAAVEKINRARLTEQAAEQLKSGLLEALHRPDLGQSFTRMLREGWKGLRLLDFEHPEGNILQAAAEVPCVQGKNRFQPDITIYVNGLPLVMIEVKTSKQKDGIPAEYDRMRRRFRDGKFRPFLQAAQMWIFSNDMENDKGDLLPKNGSFYAAAAAEEFPMYGYGETRTGVYRGIAALEREGCRDVDRVSALTGSFLGEMFVWKKDLWESDLRRTGFYLGKFIYMMDAWDDRERDRKSGSYNIWNLLDLPEERILTMMQDTMACCCRAFETLPVVETAPILRNILYAGVWTKYAVGREEKKQPRSGRK